MACHRHVSVASFLPIKRKQMIAFHSGGSILASLGEEDPHSRIPSKEDKVKNETYGTVNLRRVIENQLSLATALALGENRGSSSDDSDEDAYRSTFRAKVLGSTYNLQWTLTADNSSCRINMYLGNWNSDNVEPYGYAYIRRSSSRGVGYESGIGTTGSIIQPDEAAAYGELVSKTALIVSNILEAVEDTERADAEQAAGESYADACEEAGVR